MPQPNCIHSTAQIKIRKENSKFMSGRKNVKMSQVILENATTELHPLDSTVSSRTTVKITGAK